MTQDPHNIDINKAIKSEINSAGRDVVFNEGGVPQDQWGVVLGFIYDDLQVVRSCSLRWRTVQAVAYIALVVASVALIISGVTMIKVF